jgi:hypothetical protein
VRSGVTPGVWLGNRPANLDEILFFVQNGFVSVGRRGFLRVGHSLALASNAKSSRDFGHHFSGRFQAR